MKSKMNIRSIILVAILSLSSLLFINMSFAANTAKVKVETANLREQPSQDAKILELASIGEEVEVLEKSGDWYKVKANGKVGYVSKQYIKVKEENVISNNTTDSNNNDNDKNNVDNNIKKEEPTTTETTTTNPTENETVENKQEEQSKPMKGNFNSEIDLKVAPLINAISMNKTKSNETYDVLITAGLWSYVSSSSNSGWVLTEKITKIDDNKAEENKTEENNKTVEDGKKTEEPEKEENKSTEKTYSSAKTYYVKGTAVNARSEANKSSEVVKVLNTNDSVKVTGEDGDWYIIKIDNKKAYISIKRM